MLIQLIADHPEALGRIVRSTPVWVWGLLAALLALGASQLRRRSVTLARISLLPLAMTALSLWGTVSAFGASAPLPQLLALWVLAVAGTFALLAPGATTARYDAATRRFELPGSTVPLALIVGIFLLKWGVGVELALAPQRAHEVGFALAVAAAYGAISGVFLGRAARLWRLALPRWQDARRVTHPAP